MENNQKRKMKMLVSCLNANGSADMFACEVDATEDQYKLGEHYELAIGMAEQNGYEQPFLCYDEYEQKNIAKHFATSALTAPTMGESVQEFKLLDRSMKGESTEGKVRATSQGISLEFDGYSDNGSVDNQGQPIFIERDQGDIIIRLWENINSADPTRKIILNGARNEKRV